jgi:WD40 repeat protein
VAFSPNDRLLASSAIDGTVRVWEVESRWGADSARELIVFHGCNGIPLAFTPDGRGLIVEKGNDLVHVALPVQTEYRTLKEHLHGIQAVAYSPDGKHLAWISKDKSAVLWNAKSGATVEMGKFDEPPTAVAFSPDSQTVFLGASILAADKKKIGQIARWDIKTRKRLEPWLDASGPITTLAVSPAHAWLAAGNTKRVALWDLAAGKEIGAWNAAGPPFASSLAFHPTDKLLAGALNNTGALILWDLQAGTFKDQRYVSGCRARSVTFVPDGTFLVGDSGAEIVFVESKSAKIVQRVGPFQQGSYGAFAVTPDGKTVALGKTDRAIELWDVASNQLRATLTGHPREVSALAFSPDGKMLASGDQSRHVTHWIRGGTIKLWNAMPPEPLTPMPLANSGPR